MRRLEQELHNVLLGKDLQEEAVKLVTEMAKREDPANTQLGEYTSCVQLVRVGTCSGAICSVGGVATCGAETCGVTICGV